MLSRSGANAVLDAFAAEGVRFVFGYPGGAIMPLYDALYSHDIRHVLVRHEAAAAFAASGYARTTGEVGVCIATSGPGATNLVTGIADAMLDNVPLIAVTGQVPSGVMGTDAFQEVDIVGVTQSITKRAQVVRHASDIASVLRKAFRIARGPRPGPVLVDLPADVLRANTFSTRTETSAFGAVPRASDHAIDAVVRALQRSSRPVIIVGGGARWSGASTAYRRLIKLLRAPHCATIHGLGCASYGDRSFLGMAGMHGTKPANLAIHEADCLIALGMRFDDRITGDPKRFAPKAQTIVHADIDASEFHKNVSANIVLHGDLRETLERLNERLAISKLPSYRDWSKALSALDRRLPCDPGQQHHLSATGVLDLFFQALPHDAIVTTDVGQHQMWAAQRVVARDMTSFITSGGLGSMGFGLPAAIGANIAHPRRPIFCVVGDGGFQMSMAELATIQRYELGVKVLLIDNGHLGMVRQWQQLFLDSRYSETQLPENPDFCAIARAYGINVLRVDQSVDATSEIRRFIAMSGPALLHCVCHPHENVWPMIPSGTTTANMMEALPA